jgi:hypothetical protein
MSGSLFVLTILDSDAPLFERAMSDAEQTAFRNGFADGYEHGDNFSSGVTYDDAALNEAYDSGVNFGQAANRWSS